MTDARARLTAALADRYTIERELGAGGMATVYLAQDLKHDRKVAIKVLRPELAAVLGPERFLAEIKITARLDHPHILTLIDSGASDGFLYYVLPFVRGESLRDKLNREKQLGLDDALTITKQVASALDYAHRQVVIHRDIKPENVLIQEGEAMLTDFGIALAVKEAGGNRLTETGISLGTPQYMSPEQATGDRHPDARSDVYSLAAVLYEMLAGEPPHTGPTVQAVIAKLMTERPIRLRVLRDTVPEGIDAAVARALAKVPADRFASAADFAAALGHAAEPARAGARRPRWLLPALVAGAVVVTALAWVFLRSRPERVILPDRAQLTFTGNARTPALSADGRRLAYSTRACHPEGRCTTDVVLQDLRGAGSTTLVRGWASVTQLQWTGDGRYLLVQGFEGAGGNWGLFAVPTLGGSHRFLTRGEGELVGTSDTVLAYHVVPGDSVAWLRWTTLADGVVRDSLAVPRGAGSGFSATSSPGGRILTWRWSPVGWTATVIDRTGHQLDSLLVSDPTLRAIGPSQDGRALLVSRALPFERSQFDVLAYRISGAGRLALRPDTILRNLQGAATVAPDGSLLLASGPTRFEVWALERTGPTAMCFTQRLLASATSVLRGELSPDGSRVLLNRTTIVDGAMHLQVSVLPFEGGGERSVDVPADALGADWNWDGSRIQLFTFRGQDSITASELALSGGPPHPLFTLPWREMSGAPLLLPGGGVLIPFATPPRFRRVGAPGLPDTTFALPPGLWGSLGLASSPDGSAAVWVGWDAQGDSISGTSPAFWNGERADPGLAHLAPTPTASSRARTYLPHGGDIWLLDGVE